MNTTLLGTRVLSSLLVGTARQPIKDLPGAGADLNALSLAGQALRFERPSSPPSFSVVAQPVEDDRTILPDALRRPLLRLVEKVKLCGTVQHALAYAFDRLKLRPHPFDLPRMRQFVQHLYEHLGPDRRGVRRSRDSGPRAHRDCD